MRSHGRPIAAFLALSLFASTAVGCAENRTPLPVPAPVSEDMRASLGSVTVGATQEAPKTRFASPSVGVGDEALKGAAAGAGGTALGIGYVLVSCGMCIALVAYPPALAVMGALVGVGGLVGGSIGAINAVPEDGANAIEQRLSTMTASEAPQRMLRRAVRRQYRAYAEQPLFALAPLAPEGAAAADGEADTGAAPTAARLEVAVTRVELLHVGSSGSDPEVALAITARARLVRGPNEQTIHADENLAWRSDPRPFSEWEAGDAAALRSALGAGIAALAESIVERTFLEVRWREWSD